MKIAAIFPLVSIVFPAATLPMPSAAKPWHQAAYDYVGDAKAFICPGNIKKTGSAYGYYIDNWNVLKGSGKERLSELRLSRSRPGASYPMSRFATPSECLQVADCSASLIGPMAMAWAASVAALYPNGYFYRICTSMVGAGEAYSEAEFVGKSAHDNTNNLGFFDGHVQNYNWRECRRKNSGGKIRYTDAEIAN